MKRLFVGYELIVLDEIDSTNSYAMDLISKKDVKEGLCISANFQTNGRGQRGKNWESEKGENILCSIILKPQFLAPDKQFKLSKAISLAIFDFFKYFGLTNVFIKWPNDIYINDKKAAGILIENTIKGNKIEYSVIGLGININQTFFKEVSKGTSLAIEKEKKYVISDLYELLFNLIEARYFQLKHHEENLVAEYLNHLYRMNEYCQYLIKNELILAKINGVTNEGKLSLIGIYGQNYNCDIKEIIFI